MAAGLGAAATLAASIALSVGLEGPAGLEAGPAVLLAAEPEGTGVPDPVAPVMTLEATARAAAPSPEVDEPLEPCGQRVLLNVRLVGALPDEGELSLRISPVRWTGEGERLEPNVGDRVLDARDLFAGASHLTDVTSLFHFGRPDSLVVCATSGDLTGLAIVPCEQDLCLLEAEVWIGQGVRVSGQVVPAGPEQVGAYLMLSGRPTELRIAEGPVREDGSYELALPGACDYALCAVGDGRPGTLIARLGARGVQVLPPLQVQPGVAIEGRLGLANGWERLAVSAALQGASGHYTLGSSELTWYQGSFEWRSRERTFERHERVRFEGLAPGLYRLAVIGVSGSERVSVGRLPSVAVWAPSLGVDLTPSLARVRLLAQRDGQPAGNARLTLVQDFGRRGISHLQALTDERGVAEFWLDPDAPAWTATGGGRGAPFLPRELDGRHPRVIEVNAESLAGF